jgi:hypothetical protein
MGIGRDMEFSGVLLGIPTMLSIDLGHVWVTNVEYDVGLENMRRPDPMSESATSLKLFR